MIETGASLVIIAAAVLYIWRKGNKQPQTIPPRNFMQNLALGWKVFTSQFH